MQTYLVFSDRAEVGFCPQVSMCVTTFMGVHTLVEQQISNILLLIYSVLLIRILFEAIAQKR